jgi:hypothetical protein
MLYAFNLNIMYELFYNGDLYALFSTEELAQAYANENELGTFSIYPPNTMTRQPEYDE